MVEKSNWKENLKKFEAFLKEIPLKNYSYLRKIKTVEQDLPNELLPLQLYYKYYWETQNFKGFDEIFTIYWNDKLQYIYNFIKKYFYGCSINFVEEGLKARLYRIWVSILTQFYFQYLWNALFKEKLESSAELDAIGIDAIVELKGKKVAFQIKKVSYRREASERRFTRRQQSYADIFVEVPYLVIDVNEIINKLKNPLTKKATKDNCNKALKVFKQNFSIYQNGFVVFKRDYLKNIHETILEKIKTTKKGEKITYDQILKW
jgi:hypothetical protein